MDELIKPNWHVALVHFPIALLVIGTLIEVFSFLGWRRSGLRWAGRWMVLIGTITAVPTALSGLYALGDVLGPSGITRLAEKSEHAASMMRSHIWVQAASTALALLLVTLWIAFSDLWRDRLAIVFKLGLLVVIGMIGVGAWFAGEMVYVHEIGTGNKPTTLPAEFPTDHLEKHVVELFPLEQTHATMAGLSVAFACIALGFSARRIAETVPPRDDEHETEATQRIALAFSQDVGSIAEPRTLAAAETVVLRSPNHTPPARAWPLWVLTSLLLLGTAVGGMWILAHGIGTWNVDALRDAITQPVTDQDPKITRRLVHTITGVTIVVDTILLTIAALALPRSRLLLTILAIPLVLALLVQLWVGSLLLIEGPSGRVTELREPM